MNNDYRLKHNRLFHAQMVKQHKLIRWETLNAPKNPFEVRPAKVPRTDEVPSTSINTEITPATPTTISNADDTTPISDSIPTVDESLSFSSEKAVHPSTLEARGKQSVTSQKPVAVLGEKPYQPRDPKCFLRCGANSKRSFRPSWFDYNDWKNWLHYDVEKKCSILPYLH